ncbi:MAG: hypothetical protein ACHQ5A_03355, partial [Opitutales bacterium]
YYVANALALLLAVGLAVVGLVETPRWRWLGMTLAGLFVAGQMYWYCDHYRPVQQGVASGGSDLTAALRRFTSPREVLVIVGQDWNSMTAYYSQRRALMLRGDVEDDAARIDQALKNLTGETVGALLVTGEAWPAKAVLLGRLAAFGLSRRPLLRWRDTWLFFRRDREAQVIRAMQEGNVPEVDWAPGAEPPAVSLAGRWQEVSPLPAPQQLLFASMTPRPVRFFCRFEPARQVIAQELSFFAHPVTRLVFRLRRGAHVLRTSVWFNPGAYHPPPGEVPTDGVEVRLSVLPPGAEPRLLAGRLVDPAGRAADRGPVPLEFPFTLEQDGEVELFFGPGPQGRDTRDWIWIRGPLEID